MLEQEKKLKAIMSYMEGGISLRHVAKQYGVHHSSIEKWLHNYQVFGVEGLKRPTENRQYTEEEKLEIVAYFLARNETLYEVCKRYRLRSISLLQRWIKQYGNPSLRLTGGTDYGNKTQCGAGNHDFSDSGCSTAAQVYEAQA